MSKRTLALGMTLLFLGTTIVPVVSGDTGSSEPALPNKASSNTPSEPSSTTSKTSRTSSTSFVYGPLGNRISSTDINDATTYYLYEGTNVIQDRQQDGTLAHEYVSGVSGKLAMIDHTDNGTKPAGEDEVLYYLHDILGSVVVLIDANGNGCERYYYEPYGETVITDSTGTVKRNDSLFGNTYMWTGKEYDSENELYHFPARTYSQTLGRWLQRDPLGYVDSLNLYEYVRSNPLRYVDSLGLAMDAYMPLIVNNDPDLQKYLNRPGVGGTGSNGLVMVGKGIARSVGNFAYGIGYFFAHPNRVIVDAISSVWNYHEMGLDWPDSVAATLGSPFMGWFDIYDGTDVYGNPVGLEDGFEKATDGALFIGAVVFGPKIVKSTGRIAFPKVRAISSRLGLSINKLMNRFRHPLKSRTEHYLLALKDPNYVSSSGAARLIGVSDVTIGRWTKQGVFKKIGVEVIEHPGSIISYPRLFKRGDLFTFAKLYRYPRAHMGFRSSPKINRLYDYNKHPQTAPFYILNPNVKFVPLNFFQTLNI